MIDSHAHVAMFPREERDDVLQRAEDAGVRLVLVPATGPEDFDEVRRVVQERPERTVAALGFHPHDAESFDAGWKRRLEAALEEPGVVAVGEIGLDYYYDNSPREDQRAALRWQLALARERGMPVVLHHRDAWDDFVAILDEVPGVAGVAHSFTEGAAGAAAMMERGLHVGISGMVTFPRGDNIREAARAVSAGRLLVETDSPFLAPVPHRGKRNEPAWVTVVAEAVARLGGRDVAEVEAETDAAFEALFLSR